MQVIHENAVISQETVNLILAVALKLLRRFVFVAARVRSLVRS
jgi:hypothetical protein